MLASILISGCYTANPYPKESCHDSAQLAHQAGRKNVPSVGNIAGEADGVWQPKAYIGRRYLGRLAYFDGIVGMFVPNG